MSWLRRLLGERDQPRTDEPAEGDPVRVAEVETVIESLRPLLVADGGDIRIVRIDDEGHVSIRLLGACRSCAASPLTVRGALEPELRRRCAWVRGVHVV